MSRDSPHYQKSFNWGDIYRLLKFMHNFKPMPPIQQNHKRSFIENARCSRSSTSTRIETGSCGGGCCGKCFSRVVKPIHAEGLYENMNVSIASIAKGHLMVFFLTDLENQIFLANWAPTNFFTRTSVLVISETQSLGAAGTEAIPPFTVAGGDSSIPKGSKRLCVLLAKIFCAYYQDRCMLPTVEGISLFSSRRKR